MARVKWLENFRLEIKYRKILDHLDNDQKAEVISKKYTSLETLTNIFTYYEMDDSPCDFIIRKKVLSKRNKSSYFILNYAIHAIKDRWPEAEPYLLKNIVESIQQRSIPLEHVDACVRYRRAFIKTRWLELEKVLCQEIKTSKYDHADYALSKYVKSFKEFNVNELYDLILKDNKIMSQDRRPRGHYRLGFHILKTLSGLHG